MAAPTLHSKTGDNAGGVPGRGAPPNTPRWVKVFGVVALLLVLLFAILHLTGRGLGGHTPFGDHGPSGGSGGHAPAEGSGR